MGRIQTLTAIIVYGLLQSPLTNAAPTDGNNATDAPSVKTSNFKPQHIDLTLWNVNKEQFTKQFPKIEPSEQKPTELKTTFWTVTSKVGNEEDTDNTSAQPTDAAFQTTDVTDRDEPIHDKPSTGQNRQNISDHRDHLGSSNSSIYHNSNESESEITEAPQGNEESSNYTSSTSTPNNSTQKLFVEFEDVQTTSGDENFDPESEDTLLSVVSLEEVNATEGRDYIETKSERRFFNDTEEVDDLNEVNNYRADAIFAEVNGSRGQRQGFVDDYNSTSENETEIYSEHSEEDVDLEIYSKSSKYYGTIEQILNDDLDNELESNFTDFDSDTDDVTFEINEADNGNSSDSAFESFEDEELTLVKPSGSHGSYYSSIRLTRSKNLSSDDSDSDLQASNDTNELDFLEYFGKNEPFNLLEVNESQQNETVDLLEVNESKQNETVDLLEVNESKQNETVDLLEVNESQQNETVDLLEVKEFQHYGTVDRLEVNESQQNETADLLEVNESKQNETVDLLEVNESKQNETVDLLEVKEVQHYGTVNRLEVNESQQNETADLLEVNESKQNETVDLLEVNESKQNETVDLLEVKEVQHYGTVNRLEVNESQQNETADLLEVNESQQNVSEKMDGEVKLLDGRSFDVNKTATNLRIPDDSINDIDSVDHVEDTTVVFDLFGFVNTSWPIVRRFTTESTTRPYEPTSTHTTTENPATEHTTEGIDLATPFEEQEHTTEINDPSEFKEFVSGSTSTDTPTFNDTSFEDLLSRKDVVLPTTEDILPENSTWSVEDSSSDENTTDGPTEVPAPAATTTEADYNDGNIITLMKHLRLSVLGDLFKRTGLDKEFSKSSKSNFQYFSYQSVTIFAPTDEAFNSLSPSTIRNFQKNSQLLKSLILHHIVDLQISAKDFENERTLQSLAYIPALEEEGTGLSETEVADSEDGGEAQESDGVYNVVHSPKHIPLKLNLYEKKGATIDGARFILADIRGTNGIIHVITKVLYRFARDDLISSLQKCSRFSTILKISEKAGIDLRDGPYTIFAPVNEAWEKDILLNLTTTKAKEIFNSHVVEGSRFSSGFSDEEEVDTLKRYWTIKVGIRNGELKEVNRARVIMSDVPAINGVIHVIDRTLHETKLCDDFF
ncbi:Periostin [Nymphon striatum]|nr:Periostin [Nymphon striatum]